jgi:hypothetical protein
MTVQEPTLLFFRHRPQGWAESACIASSLQSIESSFFLVALARYPHALVVGVAAIESCLQQFRSGAKEKPTLQELLDRARTSSKVVNGFSELLLNDLRKARNRVTHNGFSPEDDSESVSLYVEAVLPFLALCYQEFHGFDLMDGLLPEYAQHLTAAEEVHRLAKDAQEPDLSYCIHGFSHSVKVSFKESFSAAWEVDALDHFDSFGGRYERTSLKRKEWEERFQVSGRFDCPACFESDAAVAEIDPDKMETKEIVTKRVACPSCGFLVHQDQPYLSEVLLRRQIPGRKAKILKAYGC